MPEFREQSVQQKEQDMSRRRKIITVVGTGMVAPRDLTLGGLKAIQEAAVVVYSAPWPGVKSWLESIGARETRDISGLYVEHGVDAENYAAILQMLFELSSTFGRIVYLVSGNPTLGVTTTALLSDSANRFETKVKVIAGVSSLDMISVDLEVDYLDRGTVVVDSNRLILYQIKLDSTLGVVIYHPASVGTSRVDFGSPWISNQISRLTEYLIKTYPPSHPCFIVLCASAPGLQAEVVRVELRDLVSKVQLIRYGSSLYLPPLQDFTFDSNYLALLQASQATTE